MSKKKEYKISSYGVTFTVEVEANHFDDFLNKFLDEGFEGGGSLLDCLSNNQCEGAMEGEFPDDCFLDSDNGGSLIEEYGIRIKFRAIDFDGCPWLDVKQK